jgi:hypothetical protein
MVLWSVSGWHSYPISVSRILFLSTPVAFLLNFWFFFPSPVSDSSLRLSIPTAMAAPANVQLSLQMQRSIQAQSHPFESALLQQTSPSPTTSDVSEGSVSVAPSTPVQSFGPPAPSLLPSPDVQSHFSGVRASCSSRSPSQIVIAHPYARLYAKKNATGAKRRKIWNHALEKSVFSAHEMYVDITNFYVIHTNSRR